MKKFLLSCGLFGALALLSAQTIGPVTSFAIGTITGLGTGVATALGINVGSAGAFVTFNGALGTPSSGVATNLTGTAAGLTAGTVTTNANLTGAVTSVGNATTLGSVPAFFANLGGSSQTGIVSATPTLVAFNNTTYNVGSLFNTSTNRWVPPAGTINLLATTSITGTIGIGTQTLLGFYKNGSLLVEPIAYNALANVSTINGSIEDRANGTDYYQIYVTQTTAAGTATVSGNNALTYFAGHWVSP